MFFLKNKIFPLEVNYNDEILTIKNDQEFEEFIFYCNQQNSYSKIKSINIKGTNNEK